MTNALLASASTDVTTSMRTAVEFAVELAGNAMNIIADNPALMVLFVGSAVLGVGFAIISKAKNAASN